jgi:hypothetical protein
MSNELEAQLEFFRGEAEGLRELLGAATRELAAVRAELQHAPPEAEGMAAVRLLDEWQNGDELRRWWTREGVCILEHEDGKLTRYEGRSRDAARLLACEACLTAEPLLAQVVRRP